MYVHNYHRHNTDINFSSSVYFNGYYKGRYLHGHNYRFHRSKHYIYHSTNDSYLFLFTCHFKNIRGNKFLGKFYDDIIVYSEAQ